MGDHTGIEWADATWITVTGCQDAVIYIWSIDECGRLVKVKHIHSDGCGECYACRLTAGRLSSQPKYEGLATFNKDGHAKWTGKIRLHPDVLTQPLRWQAPRKIFPNSMSDTWHKDVPDQFIRAMLGMAILTPRHTYQFLTKRAERLFDFMTSLSRDTSPIGSCLGALETYIGNLDKWRHSATTHLRHSAVLRQWPPPQLLVRDQRGESGGLR